MANPFEQSANLNEEMKAEAAFKKLYRDLSKLVHDDKFNGFTHKEFKEEFEENAALKQKYEELSKERDELVKAINTIKGGANSVGWYKGRNLNGFAEKLEALKEVGVDISSFSPKFEEFLKEANDYKAQSAKNKANAGAGQNTNQAGAGPAPTGGPKTADQAADEEKKAWEEFHSGSNGENSGDNDDEKRTWSSHYKDMPGGSEEKESKTKPDAAPEAKKDNTEAEKARKEEIDKLRKELSDVRKEYLEVDYKKNTALSRIRKFFGKTKENEGKGFEKDQEIAEFRAYYDNKLLELQEKIVADAKERGASDKELADIYIEFRTEQKIILEGEHDKVKAEQRFGTKMGKVGKWTEDGIKWYQKLPIKYKLAVSAAFIAGGVGLSAAGLGAGLGASIFAGSVTARRIFGGVMAGYGTKGTLDALRQRKDKSTIEKEKEEFLKKLESLSDDEKYKLLSGDIKNIAIKDKEDSLERSKKIKGLNTGVGVAVGTFIGSGMMADLAKWGFHGVTEYFSGGHGSVDNVQHQSLKPGASEHGGVVDESRVPKGYGGTSHENLASANGSEHTGSANVHPIEHAPSTPSGENLTIQQGSSIEKTLINNLKANHPEIKNPGAAAHRMFLDYMDENKESIIQKVGNGEYNKMLKDGMVNVKAGTGLNMVMENGKLKLQDIQGNISHLEHPSVNHINGVGGVTAEDVAAQQDLANELNASKADVQSEMTNLENYEKHLGGSDDIVNRTSNMLNSDHAFVQSRLQELMEKANILDSPDTKTAVVNIKTGIFGKSAKAFLALKGENIAEIMKSDDARENFLKKIPRGGRNLFNELTKQFPPKSEDTTLKWIVRVAVEAKKLKG